jgi:protein-S-isoprenylcysteine O-methyltransferase Ste14
MIAWLVASLAMLAVRLPHIRRSLTVKVRESRESRKDRLLVACVSLGLLLPLFTFGDPSVPLPRLLAGITAFALALWLLHRTHADLGRNWSNTLELREDHRLVTHGVYRFVRHPMYVALLLHGVGQALVLSNPIAGLSFLAAIGTLVAVRLPAEERMMRDEFGDAWVRYCERTPRLLPGLKTRSSHKSEGKSTTAPTPSV